MTTASQFNPATMTKQQIIARMLEVNAIGEADLPPFEAMSETEVRAEYREAVDEGMSAADFTDTLIEAISESIDFVANAPISIMTFAEACINRHNEGLVVHLPDGTEFHVTVQKVSSS